MVTRIAKEIIAGTTPTLLARLVGDDGANLQKEDVSSISYTVSDVEAPTVATAAGAIDKGTAIFDTLQTDSRWTVDTIGYNFRFRLPVTACPAGHNRYQAQVRFV